VPVVVGHQAVITLEIHVRSFDFSLVLLFELLILLELLKSLEWDNLSTDFLPDSSQFTEGGGYFLGNVEHFTFVVATFEVFNNPKKELSQ